MPVSVFSTSMSCTIIGNSSWLKNTIEKEYFKIYETLSTSNIDLSILVQHTSIYTRSHGGHVGHLWNSLWHIITSNFPNKLSGALFMRLKFHRFKNIPRVGKCFTPTSLARWKTKYDTEINCIFGSLVISRHEWFQFRYGGPHFKLNKNLPYYGYNYSTSSKTSSPTFLAHLRFSLLYEP